MIQIYKIDENGFYTFETYIVEEPNEFEITTPCNTSGENTFYKPKWDDEKWVEGATKEEIREWEEENKIDNCSEKTTEQKLEEAQEEIAHLKENELILAENIYQLANVIELLVGGTESGQV